MKSLNLFWAETVLLRIIQTILKAPFILQKVALKTKPAAMSTNNQQLKAKIMRIHKVQKLTQTHRAVLPPSHQRDFDHNMLFICLTCVKYKATQQISLHHSEERVRTDDANQNPELLVCPTHKIYKPPPWAFSDKGKLEKKEKRKRSRLGGILWWQRWEQFEELGDYKV